MKRTLILSALIVLSPVLAAKEVNIAVASNFKPSHEKLIARFKERQPDNTPRLISGSTGKLVSQIKRGAPIDVFLSADIIGVKLDDKTVAGTEFTYAIGQLALVSTQTLQLGQKNTLNCLAIANPSVAPYGVAALEVIDKLTSEGWTFDRIIKGQSVAQAFQFFDSGACPHALVAYSQVLTQAKEPVHLLIPQDFHYPIKQNAVLLKGAVGNEQAHQFIEFLKSETARNIIRDSGYIVEP